MRLALAQASEARYQGEIPVGSVVVLDGRVVGMGFNRTILDCDPGAHAEMVALRQAGRELGNYRLNGCSVYVTLEPCCMCAMALVHARVERLVFGAYDDKTGACGSCFELLQDPRHNHKVEVEGGVLEDECRVLLQDFFARRRQEQKA